MQVGKDFWFVLRLIIAIVHALRDAFEKPDEPIQNGG